MLHFKLLSFFILCLSKLSVSAIYQSTPSVQAFSSLCTWFEKRDTNTAGGIGASFNTITECRKACLASVGRCEYGFDWDPQNPNYRCWFSTSNKHAFAIGVSHFSSTCPLTSMPSMTTKPLPTTKPGDKGENCVWKQLKDTNTRDGMKVMENSLEGCKRKCLEMDKCKYGLDYNPFTQEGERCYISKDDKFYRAQGVQHHYTYCMDTRTQDPRVNKGTLMNSGPFVILSSLLVTFSGLILTNI